MKCVENLFSVSLREVYGRQYIRESKIYGIVLICTPGDPPFCLFVLIVLVAKTRLLAGKTNFVMNSIPRRWTLSRCSKQVEYSVPASTCFDIALFLFLFLSNLRFYLFSLIVNKLGESAGGYWGKCRRHFWMYCCLCLKNIKLMSCMPTATTSHLLLFQG